MISQVTSGTQNIKINMKVNNDEYILSFIVIKETIFIKMIIKYIKSLKRERQI